MSSFTTISNGDVWDENVSYNNLPNLKGPCKTVSLSSGADYYCDGTADDVQINAAIIAVNAAGGGMVWLKPGTFDITAYIDMLTGVTLRGSGFANTNLVTSADVDVIRMYGAPGTDKTGMTVKDLKCTGYYDSNAGTTMSGILIRYALRSAVQQCFITKNDHGIYIYGDSERIGLSSNLITNNDDDGILDADGNLYSVIQGNWLYYNGDCGLQLDGSAANYFGHSTITGNIIESNGSGAGGGGANNHGIYLKEARNAAVTGNWINANEGDGIKLYGDAQTASYHAITGNVLRANETHGIEILKGARNTVTGNTIINSGTIATEHGIYIHSDSDRNLITNNNVMDSNGYEIYIAAATEANNMVKNNICAGTHTGTIYDEGTATVFPEYRPVAVLVLEGGAVDLDVFHATADCTLMGYNVVYTEASSADVDWPVDAFRVGRYQNGVAIDDDYFDQNISEASVAIGYAKAFHSSDLTQTAIDDGDSVTVGTGGGKTGDGEVLIILKIAHTS